MKRGLLFAWVLASFAPLLSPAGAAADQLSLTQFFHSWRGVWRGNGQFCSYPFGNPNCTPYGITLTTVEQPNLVWNITVETRDPQNLIRRNTISYIVQGDFLMVRTFPGAFNEPVNVLESTSSTLAYSVSRVDPGTGRILTYYSRLQMGRDPVLGIPTLDSDNTTQVDGALLNQDCYHIRL